MNDHSWIKDAMRNALKVYEAYINQMTEDELVGFLANEKIDLYRDEFIGVLQQDCPPARLQVQISYKITNA